MNFAIKETPFSEIYRILETNIDKVNYLNSSLIKSSYNHLKIKRFLNEFDYDLKLIYDILIQLQKESFYKNNNGEYKREKRKNNYLNLSDRIKKHLRLNDLEENNRNNYKGNKNKDNKKYNFTINILSDKYFDSSRKMRKKFNKSNSCKSYRKKYSKNLIKNLKKINLRGNSYSQRNYEKNNNNKIFSYLTDYSQKKRFDESYNNKFRTNIDKNKVSLKNLNTLYNYYDDLLRKNNNYVENNTNYEYSTSPTNKKDLDNNYDHSTPFYKTYNLISTEENKNPEHINKNDNNIISEDNTNNSYMNCYYDYINFYERNNNYMKEEITKKIISQILQDSQKLDELKKKFGNDIGLKLLDGLLDNKEINDINDFIKKYENKEEKNLFRGSKHNYRNYKHDSNNKNDILLLRNSIRDNKYHEFNNHNNNHNYYNNKEPLSNEY